MRVLLNYRGYHPHPTCMSTCQFIDSESILTNRNSGFFLTVKYIWLTYVNHNFLARVSGIAHWSNRLAEKSKILLRSCLVDYYPRYAMLYVLELQMKVVLVLSRNSFRMTLWANFNGQRFINLIKPQRKMNQMNVKFNIKSFASSI